MEQEFTESSEFRETDKSLKHELHTADTQIPETN